MSLPHHATTAYAQTVFPTILLIRIIAARAA